MTAQAKKIANRQHEDLASITTRSASKRGPSRGLRTMKRQLNKAARRADTRIELRNQAE